MKPAWAMIAAALILTLAILAAAAPDQRPGGAATQQSTQNSARGFTIVKTLHVEVQDRQWAQMALDPTGKFLLVPRYGRITVLETASGKTNTMIFGGDGKYGIALVPELNRGFVSNSIDGTVTVFDPKTNKELGIVAIGDGAGPIIYDSFSKRVFVCCLHAWSVVGFPADIDLKTGKADQPIKLPDEPARESTMVSDGQGMLYVALNDGNKGQIAVIDMREMHLATLWRTEPELSGMAMDREHGRLFAGCRGGVEVLSAADGHEMALVPTKVSVIDTLFLDGELFARSSDGTLNVIGQDEAGKFAVKEMLQRGIMEGTRIVYDSRSKVFYLPAGGQKIAVVQRR